MSPFVRLALVQSSRRMDTIKPNVMISTRSIIKTLLYSYGNGKRKVLDGVGGGVLFDLLNNTSHLLLGWGCLSQADTRGARALAEISKVARCPHIQSHLHTQF